MNKADRDRLRLWRCEEVAAVFGVEPITVSRWAASGRLFGIRTPGGHWRFDPEYVMKLREEGFETDG